VESSDKRILSLALEALYVERNRLDEEIAAIQRRLGTARDTKDQDRHELGSKPKRLSSSGRSAISAAAKKRWAVYRARRAKPKRAR
jgi:hypothetical protein